MLFGFLYIILYICEVILYASFFTKVFYLIKKIKILYVIFMRGKVCTTVLLGSISIHFNLKLVNHCKIGLDMLRIKLLDSISYKYIRCLPIHLLKCSRIQVSKTTTVHKRADMLHRYFTSFSTCKPTGVTQNLKSYGFIRNSASIRRILVSLLNVISVKSSNLYFDSLKTTLCLRINISSFDFYFFIYYIRSFSRLNFKILLDLSTLDCSASLHKFKKLTSIYYLYYIFNNFKGLRFTLKYPVFFFANSMLSLTSLFASSTWSEREVWDMFGVYFIGNRDHRRLLTDYGFIGFPLRKSFPATGFIELYFSDVLGKISYVPVSFKQEYRKFIF